MNDTYHFQRCGDRFLSNTFMVSRTNLDQHPQLEPDGFIFLPFNTMIHMIIIKLSSSNYLLWKNQLLLLLENQELLVMLMAPLCHPHVLNLLTLICQMKNTWREKSLTNVSSVCCSPPLPRKPWLKMLASSPLLRFGSTQRTPHNKRYGFWPRLNIRYKK